MFVQIIEGTTTDPEGVRRGLEQWDRELRPGAPGFLDSVGGVTDDGRAIVVARFESTEAARANNDRPEQGEWWASMQRCLGPDVHFTESEQVEEHLGGPSHDAGFVQVMKADGIDRRTVQELDERFEQAAPQSRPDLVGGLRVWDGDDRGYEIAYFTSEDEARAAEAEGPPAELGELADEWQKVLQHSEFYDLHHPMLT